MRRREFLEAIAGISALLPGLALGLDPEAFAQSLHARAAAGGALRTLSAPQDAAVTTIADILLPQTDTIGATAVGVNRFIDLLLTEAMLAADRERFLAGLAAIEARSQSDFAAPFGALSRRQQESLVRALDERLPSAEPTAEQARAQAQAPVSAEGGYALVKRLSLLAYFTSEPVAKDLIKAPIIPGRYDGCVPV